jgi:uncharacterized repeat protein (TIGR01451 family)
VLGAALTAVLSISTVAQAAPTRRDWCGTIWSIESTTNLAWVDPSTGVTTSNAGPTSQITMPPGIPFTAPATAASVAAIGIHAASGTMFAFDRAGTNGTLYKYKFGTDATWQSVTVSGLVGQSGTQSIAGASNNLNKMTVDGNTLFIADATGIALYSIALDNNGNVIANATSDRYGYQGDPTGTPPHSTGTPSISGGDLAIDEYGDTYNISYNNLSGAPSTTTAYFYKQDSANKNWVYQGQTATSTPFAGAAFYKGDLYVKSIGQLRKVDLTRTGSGYTGWSNPLVTVGSASSTTSADLAACGTPNVVINKTQQIYTDAAATTLASSQTTVVPGQYIKYTITAQNTGDAWARSTALTDNLPAGVSYVPNSLTLNGTNLGLATYSPTLTVNAPSAGAGIIQYSPGPDTATLAFVVQVTATSGSIVNRATIAYVDATGLASEPVDCTSTPRVNCGDSSAVLLALPSVSGTVWNDSNANITLDGSEPGTDAGGLTMYAVDGSGNVLSKAAVNSNGLYTLLNLPFNSSFTLRLSTDSSATPSNPAPGAASLPSGWVNTGENKNGVTETTTPGEIAVSTGTANIVNQNFGIQRPPIATGGSTTVNSTSTSDIDVPPLVFSSNDPDGTVVSYTITAIPAGVDSITINGVTYDSSNPLPAGGVDVTAGPGGTFPIGAVSFDPKGGVTSVVIPFAVTDNAGAVSNSANATILASIAGTVWVDSDRNQLLDGSETGTNTGSSTMTVYLVNSSEIVIAKAIVTSNGAFSFFGIASGTYTMILSNDSSTSVGAAAPAPSLPTGYVNTGENEGNPSSGTPDSAPNGRITITVP